MIEEFFAIMNKIDYGFLDENGLDIASDNVSFDEHYHLLSPDELLKKKKGVCWDQVELERKLFNDKGIDNDTYFIYLDDGQSLPSHAFLTYYIQDKFYWFEHSWEKYGGIHEYSNIRELLLDVKNKFVIENAKSDNDYVFVFKYDKPDYGISCSKFYEHVQKGELLNLNEPLYFYHVVSKSADMSIGLLSLQYMYDHEMFDLFDNYVSKYKKRIVKDWHIAKYENKSEDELTREEILDALNIFRGEYGSSYIYFFRYPLKRELGKRISELLDEKDIYRIDINSELVQRKIKDIFYGYDMSNSDNDKLDLGYYKKVTEEEYFSKYDDDLPMNFSSLNHISIAFVDGYCPVEYLEKVSVDE